MQPDYAERYGELETWHWWFRGRQQVVGSVLRHQLPSRDRLDVLSVGCGPASGLYWLRSFAGEHGRVVGIDVEATHATPLQPGLHYVVGSITTVPIKEHTFDVVLALDVLEHVDDDVGSLRQVTNLARNNGLLLVTVPALPSLWGGQDVVSHHRRRYTRRTLRALFHAAGLEHPRISYFNTFLFPPIAATRWWRAARGLRNRARTDFDDSNPGVLNDILAHIFAAERHFIRLFPFPVGVSLLATVRLP